MRDRKHHTDDISLGAALSTLGALLALVQLTVDAERRDCFVERGGLDGGGGDGEAAYGDARDGSGDVARRRREGGAGRPAGLAGRPRLGRDCARV